MPNNTPLLPEFKVDCLMCPSSFSATADSLDELVSIVDLHLQLAKGEHDKHEHEEHCRHSSEGVDYKYPIGDRKGILSDKHYKWTISRLVPFNSLQKTCSKEFPPIPIKFPQKISQQPIPAV